MKLGVDIVEIDRIKNIITDSAEFVNKILCSDETTPWNLESISGKIAAKEAIIKTGFISPGEWKKIKITQASSGQPQVTDEQGNNIANLQVSISHTQNLAIAVAIYE